MVATSTCVSRARVAVRTQDPVPGWGVSERAMLVDAERQLRSKAHPQHTRPGSGHEHPDGVEETTLPVSPGLSPLLCVPSSVWHNDHLQPIRPPFPFGSEPYRRGGSLDDRKGPTFLESHRINGGSPVDRRRSLLGVTFDSKPETPSIHPRPATRHRNQSPSNTTTSEVTTEGPVQSVY